LATKENQTEKRKPRTTATKLARKSKPPHSIQTTKQRLDIKSIIRNNFRSIISNKHDKNTKIEIKTKNQTIIQSTSPQKVPIRTFESKITA
jgi:hypothetical protein